MTNLPNLLIVDDSNDNLLYLGTALKILKVNLIKAQSGIEALEKTKGIELVLAIIDIRMPGLNGYELALKMNETREVKVPIIFMTASHMDEIDEFEGYGSGAVDYIYKPINKRILQSKVSVFLNLFNQKQIIIRNAALLKKSADELIIANAALKESEEKYRSYIDHAPEGVFITDETGKYIEVNNAGCSISGFMKDETLKMSVFDMLPEESLEEGLAHFRAVVETGTAKADLLFKHKDGTKRWVTFNVVKLAENRFLGFTKDITDRKKAENELKSSLVQLHKLTQYTEKVRENERLAISRELHDDLGQALTAVKIDLGLIRQKVSDPDKLLKINKVYTLVSEIIKTVQRLTSQLRPQIIDDLGLDAAIEWYTKEFAQRNGIGVYLNLDSGIVIFPDASLTLFRIMQESLTNVARHSGATRVDIGLTKTADSINFRISDNGIGITENGLNSKKSFGIMNMIERATSLGGSLDIYRENGHGTVIKLVLPLNNKGIYENNNL
ncbi:MAG: PAS domain S-box protein [Lentimicrobiaceae bacterium]|jgi:two-component system sensor histidine kinase UhpB